MTDQAKNKITLRAFVVGTIFSVLFAVLTIQLVTHYDLYVTSTQVPVLPYVLLFLTVLLINPCCRLLRFVRPFTTGEVLAVFIMGMVSSGISTFGLSSQLLPISGSLFNGAWYNEQTKWNRTIAPYVNEDFFLSEPGIQAAATEYVTRLEELSEAQAEYDAALRVAKARKALSSQARGVGGESGRTAARESVALALDQWRALHPGGEDAALEGVLTGHPLLLSRLGMQADRAKTALAHLENAAFAKVELFRRGLPRDLRPFPGILPTTKDSFATYSARFNRLVHGRKSLQRLADAGRSLQSGSREEVAGQLQQAAGGLRRIADAQRLESSRQAAEAQLEQIRNAMASVADSMQALYVQQRGAPRDRRGAIQAEIRDVRADRRRLTSRQNALLRETERLRFEQEVTGRIEQTLADITALEHDLPGIETEDAISRVRAIAETYRFFDASLARFFLGDIPWSHWMRPLTLWLGLVALSYLVLMTFNVLIFRQWAHNEKLTYPLADLPQAFTGATDPGQSAIPSIFRSGLFWAGALVSGGFLGFNLLCATEVIPGLRPLNMQFFWTPYIEKTALQGLLPTTRSEIFFTMIGLSFLIPRKISFSLWFFFVLYMLQVLVLVWAGHGVNEESFPYEWWFTMNFRTAEGGGALVVFGAAVLFKCRQYLLCCFRGSAVADLEPGERREMRISSALFVGGSAALMLMLWRGMGANPWYTLFYFTGILLMTIAMVRAVAEGGILGFQVWSNPFHYIRTVLGMNKAWTATALYLPLMVYHAVLFLDVKAFIAPAMANALKIRSDMKMQRWRFHVAVATAIAISIVVAVVTELLLAYSAGADQMNSWFYSQFPKLSTFGFIASSAGAPPAASAAETGWMLTGGIAMALLLYLRRMCFWLPHPIGMIMLVNPLMQAYWFSILIGWICKSLVSKYGSKELYGRVRGFFLGLIFGELALVALTILCSWIFDVKFGSSGIDLNRKMF